MDRREFLKGNVFAATAGLALDACAPDASQLIPILIPEEPFIPGEEIWTRSTCFECNAACGIQVRKIDGRLVKVEGNPKHPMSRGGLCPRGQAAPQAMYHPDRIRTPMAKQEDGSFAELTWDEALERIANALGSAERMDFPFAFLTGTLTGHRRAIVERFLKAFGSSDHILHEPFSTTTLERASTLATGHERLADPDLENAGYVVSFGAEMLEADISPVRFHHGLAELRQGRPGRRGKFVMIGPRLSLTAANADEWIPTRTGEEIELALGIAHVLIRDGRNAASAIGASEGFEAFRALVEEVEPSATAERLAQEMAEHGPTICLAGGSAVRSGAGLALALAVSHLNALLGKNMVPAEAPPFAPWPALEGPEIEKRALTQALGSEPPNVLFIVDTNPLYSLPPAFEAETWLSSVSLRVSFSAFMDETTAASDLVLPESMSFERFEDAVPAGAPVPMATLAQPLLVRTLYDTRSMPDALLAIAKGTGRADAFPWSSYEAALREAWAGLDTSWSDALARGGFWSAESAGEPGRYRFETAAIRERSHATPGLELHVYASNALGDGRSAHLPFLQELSDPITGIRWGSVAEINADRAGDLGIASGDLVELRSESGAIEARAHVTPGLHPDMVAIAAGQGHTGYGRYSEGRGVNAFALLNPASDADGELLAGTKVTVRKL